MVQGDVPEIHATQKMYEMLWNIDSMEIIALLSSGALPWLENLTLKTSSDRNLTPFRAMYRQIIGPKRTVPISYITLWSTC